MACFHRNLSAQPHCFVFLFFFYRMASVQYKQHNLWKVSVCTKLLLSFKGIVKIVWDVLFSFKFIFESPHVSSQLQQALQYQSSKPLIQSRRHPSPAWALWLTALPPCWPHPIRHPLALWGIARTCLQAPSPLLNTISEWYVHKLRSTIK